MLSQLTKTIKLALKSTEEERAILRARSAVQRFPVVEWRQRLEDFQRRSITVSRSGAGEHAWGFDEVDSLPRSGFYMQEGGSTTSLARGEWGRPGTPDSMPGSPMPESRRLSASGASTPQGDNRSGYFENNNNLSAGPGYHDRFGSKDKRNNRTSAESFYDEDPNASPLYYEDKRQSQGGRPKFFHGYDEEDARSSQGSSDHGDGHNARDSAAPHYDNFLAAANRQFSKQSGGRNAPDPYFDARQSMDGRNFAPSRPFSMHSRVSSFDSISSIVDEKGASSPLNKAMESVSHLSTGLVHVADCVVYRLGRRGGTKFRAKVAGSLGRQLEGRSLYREIPDQE
jgi:alpha-1,3-glucan synthase